MYKKKSTFKISNFTIYYCRIRKRNINNNNNIYIAWNIKVDIVIGYNWKKNNIKIMRWKAIYENNLFKLKITERDNIIIIKGL